MRDRWPSEKRHIREGVVASCRDAKYTREEAERAAEKVLKLLGNRTPQPIGAARWLQKRQAEMAGTS